jgi:hypothetical protein
MTKSFPILLSLSVGLTLAKDPKPAKIQAPAHGIKTPGVLIPYAGLKSDAEIALEAPATGFLFTDAIALNSDAGIRRFDAKTNKPFEPSKDIAGIEKPCGGLVNAFSFVWTASCGKLALAKVQMSPAVRPAGRRGRPEGGAPPAEKAPTKEDAAKPVSAAPPPPPPPPARPATETAKPAEPAKAEPLKPPAPPVFIETGSAPVAVPALAASEDSIWMLSDAKTALLRIDPIANRIVAEMRLPAACASILYAESALWVACPSESRLLRIDPKTNLVEKRIEIAKEPLALAAGEGSIWVLCRKEGKIARIDPKTNKVSATIDLSIPNAEGMLAFGEGSLWASAPGYPVMRITPVNDKVAQQFHGEGGGIIHFGLGSVWVSSAKSKSVWRFDPKRIQATLAD